MKRKRSLLLTFLAIAATLLVPTTATRAHAVNTFQKCDVFAGLVSDTQIAWWRPDKCGIPSSMTLQGIIKSPITGYAGTGMAFNIPSCALGPGNPCLYATEFSAQTVTVFDNTGAFLGTCGTGYNANPESIVVDTKSSPGAIYVGQADGSRTILKFNLNCSTGTPASFSPATESRGTDHIDLVAPDTTDGGSLCDMQYTSEAGDVLTYDICSNTQEGKINVTPLPGPIAYAHRQLTTDHSVLVGDTSLVVHLNSAGNQISTCDSSGGILFALNILPGSKEFLTSEIFSGKTDYFTIAHCDAGNTTPDFSFDAIPPGCTGSVRCIVGGLAVFGEVTAVNPGGGVQVSKFFTDTSNNPLPLDSNGNPKVDVVLANSIVRSTNPGEIIAWVNVTNAAGSPVQSLKVNETLPMDWVVAPKWLPAKGAIHVYFANTTSLSTNPEITDPKTIAVTSGNPQTVLLAIPDLNATSIGHPLLAGQSILLAVKLDYGLDETSQSFSSYPRNYTDIASAAAWTQVLYTGTETTATASGSFIAYAKLLGDVNGDNNVDIVDVALVAYAFNSRAGSLHWTPNADFNGDGAVDIGDVATVAFYYGTSA